MTSDRPLGLTKSEMESLMGKAVDRALSLASAELSYPALERAQAEEALRLARTEHRPDDKVFRGLESALKDLLDFQHDSNIGSRQKVLELDDPREAAAWRSAMGMAIALIDLKRDELPTIAATKVRSALDEIATALHAAHDEGPSFTLPRKLGRHKPRTPKPPTPRRPPRTMQEGLLAALPSDGTPVPRAVVEAQMIAGNFAASKRSASRAFRELVEQGRISERGVRGRTFVALKR